MEGRTDDSHVDEVLRRSRALKDDASALVGEVKGALEDLSRALDLKGRMHRNPWGTVAVAVGVGYLLGGGLFTRTTARLLHLGSRVVLVPMLRAQLDAFGQAASAAGAGRAPGGYQGSEDTQGGL